MKEEIRENSKPRLPPGQRLTEKFPVLQKGSIPHVDRETYKLRIEGEVENPFTMTIEELKEIQDVETIVDIHCVTTWSKFDTKWGGISFEKILNMVNPKEPARFVEFLCADGEFTTTVPIDAIKK